MTKQERFLAKVEKTDSCWLWRGWTGGDGYGRTAAEGRSAIAHRVSYQLFNGEIPEGLIVRHTCDTPACVRPDHLILGTSKDNAEDIVRHGRKAKRFLNRRPNGWFKSPRAKDLFLQDVEKTPGCWVWQGLTDRLGYGQVSRRGKCCSAHRVAYELFNGPIPNGLHVRHACDNPSCVRPDHLVVGTHRQNIQDAIERRRHQRGANHWSKRLPERIPRGERHSSCTHPESVPRGEDHWTHRDRMKAVSNAAHMKKHIVRGSEHGNAKVTAEMVVEIRRRLANGERPTHLANNYPVSRRAIRDIGIGAHWGHIPGALRSDQLPKRGLLGVAHPRARFTAEQVVAMRRRWQQGESMRQIAVAMGIPKATAREAIVGKTYAEL